MSDRNYWRHRLTFTRRTHTGIDPVTRLPTVGKTTALEDEPCDIEITTRRVKKDGPNGTEYVAVRKTLLHLHPADISDAPDENDVVEVTDDQNQVTSYKILSSTPNVDAGDGRYMGSLLEVQAIRAVDTTAR